MAKKKKKSTGPSSAFLRDVAAHENAAKTMQGYGSDTSYNRLITARQRANQLLLPTPKDQYESFINNIQRKSYAQNLIGQEMNNGRLSNEQINMFSTQGADKRFKSLIAEGKRLNKLNPELAIDSTQLPVDSRTNKDENTARYEEFAKRNEANLKALGLNPDEIDRSNNTYNVKQFMQGNTSSNYNAAAALRASGYDPKEADWKAGEITGMLDTSKFSKEELKSLKDQNTQTEVKSSGGNSGGGSTKSGQDINQEQDSNFNDFTKWVGNKFKWTGGIKDAVWDDRFYKEPISAAVEPILRAGYATAGMSKELSAIDEDTNLKDSRKQFEYRKQGESLLQTVLRNTDISSPLDLLSARTIDTTFKAMGGGVNPLSGLDEALSDPSKGLNVLKEGWKGLSGKEKDSWADVYSQNAKKVDPNRETILSNPWFTTQQVLTGSIFTDPISYVGPGAVKAVGKGVGAAGRASGVTPAAKAIRTSRATKVRDSAIQDINAAQKSGDMTRAEAKTARSDAWSEFLRKTNKDAYYSKMDRPRSRLAEELGRKGDIRYAEIKKEKGAEGLQGRQYDDDHILTEDDYAYLLGVGQKPVTKRQAEQVFKRSGSGLAAIQGASETGSRVGRITKDRYDEVHDILGRYRDETVDTAGRTIREEAIRPTVVADDTSNIVEGDSPDFVSGDIGDGNWKPNGDDPVEGTTLFNDLNDSEAVAPRSMSVDSREFVEGQPREGQPNGSLIKSDSVRKASNVIRSDTKFSKTSANKVDEEFFGGQLSRLGLNPQEIFDDVREFFFSGKIRKADHKKPKAANSDARYNPLLSAYKRTNALLVQAYKDKELLGNESISRAISREGGEAADNHARLTMGDGVNSKAGIDEVINKLHGELDEIFGAALRGRIRAASLDVRRIQTNDNVERSFAVGRDVDSRTLNNLIDLRNAIQAQKSADDTLAGIGNDLTGTGDFGSTTNLTSRYGSTDPTYTKKSDSNYDDIFEYRIEHILDDLEDGGVARVLTSPYMDDPRAQDHVLRQIRKELNSKYIDPFGISESKFTFDDIDSHLKSSDGRRLDSKVINTIIDSIDTGGTGLVKISPKARVEILKGSKDKAKVSNDLDQIVSEINKDIQHSINENAYPKPVDTPAKEAEVVDRSIKQARVFSDYGSKRHQAAKYVEQFWDSERNSLYFTLKDGNIIYLNNSSPVPKTGPFTGSDKKELASPLTSKERKAELQAKKKAWEDRPRTVSLEEQMNPYITQAHVDKSEKLHDIRNTLRDWYYSVEDMLPEDRPSFPTSPADFGLLYDNLHATGAYHLPAKENFIRLFSREHKSRKALDDSGNFKAKTDDDIPFGEVRNYWLERFLKQDGEALQNLSPAHLALNDQILKNYDIPARSFGEVTRAHRIVKYGDEDGIIRDTNIKINNNVKVNEGSVWDKVNQKALDDKMDPYYQEMKVEAKAKGNRDYVSEGSNRFEIRLSPERIKAIATGSAKRTLASIRDNGEFSRFVIRDANIHVKNPKVPESKAPKFVRTSVIKEAEDGTPVEVVRDVYVPQNSKEYKNQKDAGLAKLHRFQSQERKSLAEAVGREQRAVDAGDSSRVEMLEEAKKQLNGLKAKHAEENSRMVTAFKKEKQAREVIESTLKEDALIRIIQMPMTHSGFKGRLSNWAYEGYLDVPGFSSMIKAMEKVNSPEYLQKWVEDSGKFRNFIVKATSTDDPDARLAYSNIFRGFDNFTKSSSEVQHARARFDGQSQAIIAQHVRRLQKLRKFSKSQRISALKSLAKDGYDGVETPAIKAVKEELDRLLPKISRAKYFGMSTNDILRYAHRDFRLKPGEVDALLHDKDNIHHLADILLRSMNSKHASGTDPLVALWKMNISVEQAVAHLTLKNDIIKMGVPQIGASLKGSDLGQRSVQTGEFLSKTQAAAVRGLKDLGYREVPGFGATLFHKDLVPEINKLMKLTTPGNEQNQLLNIFDSVTRMWKKSITVYNPAYYTNNMYGEILAGYLGGVKNPKRYNDARGVIRVMNKSKKNDDINFLSKNGYDQYLNKGKNNPEAKPQVVVVRRGNDTVDRMEAALLYQEHGLGSTYANTEIKQGIRRVPGLAKTSDKLQDLSEWTEDLPRMAHFIDAMNKAPKNLSVREAATYAAEQVRKYHFDYSDLSNFEKTVLMRVIPFYTFTRKAITLTAQMILQRPGRLLTMPKAYAAAMEGFGPQVDDPEGNAIGYAPNYEAIGTPDWLVSAGGIPIPIPGFGNSSLGQPYHRPQDPTGQAQIRADQPAYTVGSLAHPGLKLLDKIGQENYDEYNFRTGEDESVNPFKRQLTEDTIPQTELLKRLSQWREANKGTPQRKDDFQKFMTALLGTGMNRDYK